jgi:hypothetical protein
MCSNAGIYVYLHDHAEVILIVYVDDLLYMSPSLSKIKRMKKLLTDKFQMRDLGPASIFLEMQITRDQSKKLLMIDQQVYTKGIITWFNMHSLKPRYTLLLEGIHLKKRASDFKAKASQQTFYQQMIGSLIYLMIETQSGIAWSTSQLSQYMQKPTDKYVEAAKHIFRQTTDHKIRYQGAGHSELIGYLDADWGENWNNRRSNTGFVFLMADGAVTWTLRMQKTVARLSTEAEYMVLSEACSEIAWLILLQREISYSPIAPTPLVSDNKGGIFLAINPAHDCQLKHVDIRYHFIQEYVESQCINIVYISTDDMIADILTKTLRRVKFEYFRKLLRIDY